MYIRNPMTGLATIASAGIVGGEGARFAAGPNANAAFLDAGDGPTLTPCSQRGMGPLFAPFHGIAYANGPGSVRRGSSNGKEDLLSPFLRTIACFSTGENDRDDSLRYKVWKVMVARGQYEDALAVQMHDKVRQSRKNEAIARTLISEGYLDFAATVNVAGDRLDLDRMIALRKAREGRSNEIGIEFRDDRIFHGQLHRLALDMIDGGELIAVRDGLLPALKRMNARFPLINEVKEELELATANRALQENADSHDQELYASSLETIIEERGGRGVRVDDAAVQMMEQGHGDAARKALLRLARRQDNSGSLAAIVQANAAHALARIGRKADASGIYQSALAVELDSREVVETLSKIGTLMLESGFVELASRVKIPSDKNAETNLHAQCVYKLIGDSRLREAADLARRCSDDKVRDELVAQIAVARARNRDFDGALQAEVSEPKLLAQVKRLVAIEMVRCGMNDQAFDLVSTMSEADDGFVKVLVADRYMREGREEDGASLIDSTFSETALPEVKLAAARAAIGIGRLDWAMRGFNGVVEPLSDKSDERTYWLNRILEVIYESYQMKKSMPSRRAHEDRRQPSFAFARGQFNSSVDSVG